MSERLVFNVVNRETGEVEATIRFSPSEQEMPAYVDHVVRGYDGTPWRAERVAPPELIATESASTVDAPATPTDDEAAR